MNKYLKWYLAFLGGTMAFVFWALAIYACVKVVVEDFHK